MAGYGAARVLHGVTVHLEQGETVVLLGANGNGKSTLINCLMGLVRPSQGTILLEVNGVAQELTGLSTESIVDMGIALVPEGRRLFPNLTVRENLLLGAYRLRLDQREQKILSFVSMRSQLLRIVKNNSRVV